MGDVVSFKPKKVERPAAKKKQTKASARESLKKNAPQAEKRTVRVQRSKTKKTAPNSESIKLWWISQEFDELIRKAIIDKHIPVEELSAVMAHRLGSLLVVSERTPELTLFCLKLISKITNQKETGSNAS